MNIYVSDMEHDSCSFHVHVFALSTFLLLKPAYYWEFCPWYTCMISLLSISQLGVPSIPYSPLSLTLSSIASEFLESCSRDSAFLFLFYCAVEDTIIW